MTVHQNEYNLYESCMDALQKKLIKEIKIRTISMRKEQRMEYKLTSEKSSWRKEKSRLKKEAKGTEKGIFWRAAHETVIKRPQKLCKMTMK